MLAAKVRLVPRPKHTAIGIVAAAGGAIGASG